MGSAAVSYHSDGFVHSNGRVVEVYSTWAAPRMPSDGSCGCRRLRRGEEKVVELCERHGKEPHITRWMLAP